jgi:hypothetical protein
VSRHDGSLWNHSPNFLLISHVLVSREMEKLLFCKKLFFFFFGVFWLVHLFSVIVYLL